MVTRYAALAAAIVAMAGAAAAETTGAPEAIIAQDSGADAADGQEGAAAERLAEAGATPGLPLAYLDQARIGGACEAAMQAEVARILTAAGIDVDDFTEATLTGGERSPLGFEVRIVIRDTSPIRMGLSDNAMGVTIGKQMPPSNVYLFNPVIRRVLGIDTEHITSLSEEEIGRAYGRVVVHELVHAFAPDHKHGLRGIMGHEQDRETLTAPGTTLDVAAAAALRQGWEQAKRASAGG